MMALAFSPPPPPPPPPRGFVQRGITVAVAPTVKCLNDDTIM